MECFKVDADPRFHLGKQLYHHKDVNSSELTQFACGFSYQNIARGKNISRSAFY